MSLTSALDGGQWSASRHSSFIPWERAPGTHWTGGWVGHKADLTRWRREKRVFAPAENPNPIVQPVAQSLYRLSYPDK